MFIEYAKFALDCLAQIGIMVVLCGITACMIAFLGGFIFWLFAQARREKSKWED